VITPIDAPTIRSADTRAAVRKHHAHACHRLGMALQTPRGNRVNLAPFSAHGRNPTQHKPMSDILVHTEAGVTTLTFNRPDKKNSITAAMYAALADALEAAEADPAVRCVLFQGNETTFSAGNDIGDFLNNPPATQDSPVFRFLRGIAQFSKPALAVVCGPAVGIGTTLLLHCDLAYASEQARFRMPFVNLGLCPEAGSSLLVPLLMGHRRAAQYLLLGEEFDAATARELGLVNGVFPADELHEAAFAVAKRLTELPPHAVRTTKALLKRGQNQILRETILEEGGHFMTCLRSPEAAEALQAFLQHRKPDFSAF